MADASGCSLTQYPADVLAQTARPVEKIDSNIRRIVEKMFEIMVENKGIGLAGPQAGIPLRIFIISLDGKRESLQVYINPTIKPSGPMEAIPEGCLSVPGVDAKIKRYKKCSVTATDIDGNEFTQEAEGLLSRALQHEYDHLQGRLIIDRMGQVAKIAARKTLKKLRTQADKT